MRSTVVPLVAASLLAAASAVRAADTPRSDYEHNVGCTARTMAAQAAVAREGAKGGAESARDDAMVKAMHDEAVAAGAKVGVSAEQVSLRIDQERDRFMRELDAPDAAKAKQSRGEIGRAVLVCAFDELGRAIAARKAAAAGAPSGK